jgi:hypothetical protein
MKNGRENRNNGNEEKGCKEDREEKEEITGLRPNKGARKRPLRFFVSNVDGQSDR